MVASALLNTTIGYGVATLGMTFVTVGSIISAVHRKVDGRSPIYIRKSTMYVLSDVGFGLWMNGFALILLVGLCLFGKSLVVNYVMKYPTLFVFLPLAILYTMYIVSEWWNRLL